MCERVSWSNQSSLVSVEGVYSVNWDEFCFETELQARAVSDKMYLEELQRHYDSFIEKVKGLPSIPNKLERHINAENRIQSDYEDADIKAKQLEENYMILINENKNLSRKKEKLEQIIEKTKEDLLKDEKDYQQYKKSYDMALSKYCKNFDLDISCTSITEFIYEAFVKFKSRPEMKPIKIVVDSSQRKILEFDAREVCTKEDSTDFSDKIVEPSNVPLLLCKIRDIFIKSE